MFWEGLGIWFYNFWHKNTDFANLMRHLKQLTRKGKVMGAFELIGHMLQAWIPLAKG
jgi:hypothetical protein